MKKMDKHKVHWSSNHPNEKLQIFTINAPRTDIQMVDQLVKMGVEISRSEFCRKAIRKALKEEQAYYAEMERRKDIPLEGPPPSPRKEQSLAIPPEILEQRDAAPLRVKVLHKMFGDDTNENETFAEQIVNMPAETTEDLTLEGHTFHVHRIK